MDNELVSVIIPTYNRDEILMECVKSVLESDYQNIEVLVVDNNSTDFTVKRVEDAIKWDKRLKLIRSDTNLMAAGGRNLGIKKASGKYLLFLDNDNLVYKDMITKLVTAFSEIPECGFMGALSLNQHNDNRIWTLSGSYNFWTSRPINLGADKKIEEIKLEKYYETFYCQNVSMIKKEVIEKVGGFDTNYFAMYEEADFGYRISKAGIKMYLCTEARTKHLYYCSEGQNRRLRTLGIEGPERAWHFAKNRSVFMKKYAPWYCKPVFFGIFVHLFAIYYCTIAIKEHRYDIAKAWFLGTYVGVTKKVDKDIYFPI